MATSKLVITLLILVFNSDHNGISALDDNEELCLGNKNVEIDGSCPGVDSVLLGSDNNETKGVPDIKECETGCDFSDAVISTSNATSDGCIAGRVCEKLQKSTGDQQIEHEVKAITRYMNLLPPIIGRNTSGLSEKCSGQIQKYIKALDNLELWAMMMYDASAKVPSGLLNGNVNQYGHFDQCLQINSISDKQHPTNENIKGKYCLPFFQVTLREKVSKELKSLYQLVHSYFSIRSKLSDPGHRVPRFSSIAWGLCLPNDCTASDITVMLENFIDAYGDKSIVNIEVLMDDSMCQVEKDEPYSFGAKITGLLFLTFIAFVLYATMTDNGDDSKNNELVACFSLKRTFKSLFSLQRSHNDILTIHGIRWLNAMLLIFSHKSMAIHYYPLLNRSAMVDDLSSALSTFGRSATVYTDIFLMLSGLLTCYSILEKVEKKKNISVWKEYGNRFFRLIPMLGALILFCTWILPSMSTGPLWPLLVEHHSKTCKNYWWRNILFIHNYFGFENICYQNTHHIGIDTQLFVFSVPIIIFMAKNRKYAGKIMGGLIALSAVSSIARFYVSYVNHLANFVYFGVSLQQLFRTADLMYILAPYRVTVYVMGIILGYYLRYPPKNHLSKINYGWVLSSILFWGMLLCSIHMSKKEYEYSSFNHALHATLSPICWCSLSWWVIYASYHGISNFFGNIYSWRGFMIWTRISYGVYLVQFPYFFYILGQVRGPQHYTFLSVFNINDVMVISILAIIMTVLFDLPFQNVKKSLFDKQSVSEKHCKVENKMQKELNNTKSD